MTVTAYHGSYKPIVEFVSRRFEGVGGIYFTPSLTVAASLAEMACCGGDDAPTVMEVSLRIENPREMPSLESQVLTISEIDELVARGYDGVVGLDCGVVSEYVVFDPDQVAVTAVIAVGAQMTHPSP